MSLQSVIQNLFGFYSNEIDLDPNSDNYLNELLQKRQRFLRRALALRRGAILATFFIVFFTIGYAGILYFHKWIGGGTFALFPLLYIPMVIVFGFFNNVAQAKQDVEDVLSELDLKNIRLEERETRAQKLFQLHQRELKRYYDQSLSQGLWIFLVGVVCLSLGFSVVAVTFYEVFVTSSMDLSNKIIVGVVGAISGILTNFIAAIYLRMFGDTVKSATEFHNRLVATHHLHFGNFLISKIEDSKLRDQALVDVSRAIAEVSRTMAKEHNSGAKPDGSQKKTSKKPKTEKEPKEDETEGY